MDRAGLELQRKGTAIVVEDYWAGGIRCAFCVTSHMSSQWPWELSRGHRFTSKEMGTQKETGESLISKARAVGLQSLCQLMPAHASSCQSHSDSQSSEGELLDLEDNREACPQLG